MTSAAPIWWVVHRRHVRGESCGSRGREWRPTSVLHDGGSLASPPSSPQPNYPARLGPPPTAAATQPPRGPAVATLAPCAHSREDPHPTRWSGGAWSRPDGCTPTGWSSSPGTGSSRSARPKSRRRRRSPRPAGPGRTAGNRAAGPGRPALPRRRRVRLHRRMRRRAGRGCGPAPPRAGDDLGGGRVVTDEPERMLAAAAAAARAADRGLVAAVLVEGPFLASGHQAPRTRDSCAGPTSG